MVADCGYNNCANPRRSELWPLRLDTFGVLLAEDDRVANFDFAGFQMRAVPSEDHSLAVGVASVGRQGLERLLAPLARELVRSGDLTAHAQWSAVDGNR